MDKKENKIQGCAVYQRCFSLKDTHKSDSEGMETGFQHMVTDITLLIADRRDLHSGSKKGHYVMIKQIYQNDIVIMLPTEAHLNT